MKPQSKFQKPKLPKLTARQIHALSAVRDATLKPKTKYFGWRTFQVFEYEGKDITLQLKALRRRRLVQNDWFDACRTQRTIILTPAGRAFLHLVGH